VINHGRAAIATVTEPFEHDDAKHDTGDDDVDD
jgi:hypothetical protein